MRFVVVLEGVRHTDGHVYRGINVSVNVSDFSYWAEKPGADSHQVQIGYSDNVLAV